MDVAPVFGVMIKPPVEEYQDLISLGFSYRGRIGNFFGTGPALTEVGNINDDGMHGLSGQCLVLIHAVVLGD